MSEGGREGGKVGGREGEGGREKRMSEGGREGGRKKEGKGEEGLLTGGPPTASQQEIPERVLAGFPQRFKVKV